VWSLLDSISIQFEDIFYREIKTSCCLMGYGRRQKPGRRLPRTSAAIWATVSGDDLGENVGRDLTREPEHRVGNPEDAGAGDRARLSSSLQREEDERANVLGLVITAAMLFVLFAAAMLFGSHGTIGSIPRHATSAAPTPDAKAMGNLLYGAQGAASCPQMSFDRANGSAPGPKERCFGDDGSASHPHD
jgi:hypothetical protein